MFVFLSLIILTCAAVYGAYWYWHRRVEADLAEGAVAEFERLGRVEPALLEGLDQPRFAQIYSKAEMPRLPGHAVAIIITFLVGTPIFLALLSGGDALMHHMNMVPASAEVVARVAIAEDGSTRMVRDVPPEALQYYVEDLGGFYYFFGLLGFWVAIVWFFMRRYHSRTPGSVRDEVIRAR